MWDCDTCKTNVKAMLEILVAPSTASTIVEALKGEEFCQDPSLAFTEEQVKECQEYITEFIPLALQDLFGLFPEEDVDYYCGPVCNKYTRSALSWRKI